MEEKGKEKRTQTLAANGYSILQEVNLLRESLKILKRT